MVLVCMHYVAKIGTRCTYCLSSFAGPRAQCLHGSLKVPLMLQRNDHASVARPQRDANICCEACFVMLAVLRAQQCMPCCIFMHAGFVLQPLLVATGIPLPQFINVSACSWGVEQHLERLWLEGVRCCHQPVRIVFFRGEAVATMCWAGTSAETKAVILKVEWRLLMEG